MCLWVWLIAAVNDGMWYSMAYGWYGIVWCGGWVDGRVSGVFVSMVWYGVVWVGGLVV